MLANRLNAVFSGQASPVVADSPQTYAELQAAQPSNGMAHTAASQLPWRREDEVAAHTWPTARAGSLMLVDQEPIPETKIELVEHHGDPQGQYLSLIHI